MNTISETAAPHCRQPGIRICLIVLCLLIPGAPGCALFGPISIECEDIPITVAPGTCTPFLVPPCFGDLINERTFILASGDESGNHYSVIGDEIVGFQFCAAASAESVSENVPYLVTEGRQTGRGDFKVTVASFEISITDSPDPVGVGSDLTYAITVTNRTQESFSGLLLVVGLGEVTFVSGLAAGCDLQADTVRCRNLGIDAGGAVSYHFVVRPTTPGVTSVTAFLFNGPPTNSASSSTTVVPASGADLSVVVSDSPDPVMPGGTLTYTIIVTNNGPSLATGVRLTDLLPPLEVFNIVVSQGSYTWTNPSAIICEFGALASGDSATLTVTGATVATGANTNSATANANEPDPHTANNTVSENTTVSPP